MGDIDHFKLKNDTHGHIFGDRILARVGAELRKTRGDDVAGRYGGEEFAIITMLSNGNENDANVVTRGIAEKVAALEFRSIEGQAVPVTMSIGFTIITPQEAESLLSDGTLNAMLRQLEQPDKIESLDGYISEVFEKLTFMGRADKALYFAKQNGRQKVVGFVPGVPDSFEVTFDLKKA
jgi:diguanylate cyclase (GGDEF)-like protein